MGYTEITAVKGMRNDVGPERFALGDLLYARNVDIDESGKIDRRQGTSVLFAGAAHSVWTDGTQGFFVQGGSLKQFQQDGSTLALSPVAGARVCYASINESVFWSDNIASGIVANNASHQWGITPPGPITPQSGLGALPPGTYLCTMTFADHNGKESGAPRSSSTMTEGSLIFTNLPVSPDPRVALKNIYVSAVDGELPMLTAIIENSVTSLTITDLPEQTLPVRTMFMGPPPPGQIVGYFNGRAYIATGPFLFYSQPYEYELFDLRTGFLAFDSDVQTFCAMQDGIFVGTTAKTVFLDGTGPESFISKPASPYGTVMGTEVKVSGDAVGAGVDGVGDGQGIAGTMYFWMSRRGLVLGADGGLVKDLTAKHFVPPVSTSGAALLKWRTGTPQYVVSLSK